MFPIFRNGSFLVLVSQWKLRMGTYDWEQIQPSQLKETIFSTGFKFVFFLSLYSFSSSGSLRAVGLNALTVIELQKQEKRKPSHLDFCIDKRVRAFLTRLKYIHAQDLIHRRQLHQREIVLASLIVTPHYLILRANVSLLHGFPSFASLFSRVVALF